MSDTLSKPGLGWMPDLPDLRDLSAASGRAHVQLTRIRLLGSEGAVRPPEGLPKNVDLRPWCSPIEDQKSLGSCTAHAGVGMVEYFERRSFGKHIDASRLFLYKTTRNLMKLTGDTGAHLRTTMKSLVLFGVPPEEYWPYDVARFDVEPTAFCYAFGQSYQTLTYYRLDPPDTTRPALLRSIKSHLGAGLPSIFGFTVYSSYTQATKTGKLPFPRLGEEAVGGHAVMAVGYDDALEIANSGTGGPVTQGALLIRNSWGRGWGADGYGWLPYQYVLTGQATDWWSLIKSEWIDTGAFD